MTARGKVSIPVGEESVAAKAFPFLVFWPPAQHKKLRASATLKGRLAQTVITHYLGSGWDRCERSDGTIYYAATVEHVGGNPKEYTVKWTLEEHRLVDFVRTAGPTHDTQRKQTSERLLFLTVYFCIIRGILATTVTT